MFVNKKVIRSSMISIPLLSNFESFDQIKNKLETPNSSGKFSAPTRKLLLNTLAIDVSFGSNSLCHLSAGKDQNRNFLGMSRKSFKLD